jgi:hypothetical protein
MRFFSVRRVAAGAGVAAGLVLLSSVFPLRAQESRSPQGLLVTQVAERVHMISGDGSNIAVQSGPDGVVLVDSGAGRRSTEVLAAVKALASEPIRYVINTSADAQAVGGNAVIAAAGDGLGAAGGGAAAAFGGVRTGAARLGHENVLLRMSMPAAGRPAFPEPAWPTEATSMPRTCISTARRFSSCTCRRPRPMPTRWSSSAAPTSSSPATSSIPRGSR